MSRRCWLTGVAPVDAPFHASPSDASLDGSAGVCSGSERSCITPNQPQHCEGGAWVADPLCESTAPICDHGLCSAPCVAPAMRCLDGRTPQSCNPSGLWDTLPSCTYLCTGAGECTGECAPNDRECRNGNELWTCGPDGTWALSQSCELICEDASCGGDCTTNQTRCNPTRPEVPQTCNGGHWQDQAPCTFDCLPSGTCAPECDPAGPGTCIGGDAFHCDATGRFVFSETCTTNCSAGVCTGTCRDGDRQCSGSGNRTPQTCTGGVWIDATPCEFVCDQGSCVVTECHPNIDRKCENGTPFSCDATGRYVAGPPCAFVCDGDHCGGICRPGTFRCNGSTNLEKCAVDGKSWALDHACPFGCSANQCNACTPESMAQTCMGKCGTVMNNCGTAVSCGDMCAATHGANWSCGPSHTCECARDVAADCAAKCGTITDRCGFSVDCSAPGNGGVACTGAGQICRPDHSCCTQEPLGTTCSGDPGDDCSVAVPNNCGVTVTCSSACDNGFICGGNSATPTKCTCAPAAVRCVGSIPQTCNGAGVAWVDGTSCSIACIDGVGCGSCIPTHTQCADATHVQTCQGNGTFGAAVECPANAPACRPSTGACGGVCVPGTRQCRSNPSSPGFSVQECSVEGAWMIVEPCGPLGCKGDLTACAQCDASYDGMDCNHTMCDANGSIVPGPGCGNPSTFCCCVDQGSGEQTCTRKINCPEPCGP